MPELPEVERARLLAASVLEGRVIVDTRCARDPIVFQGVSAVTFARALRGKRILKVHRWGKQLWFELDAAPHPLFHFAMTGSFRTRGSKPLQLKSGPHESTESWPPRFTKIRLRMDDENELIMTDARRLGRILLRDDPLNTPPLRDLGFDPYLALAKAQDFRKKVRARKTPIKALLLDQKFCAGVGNWMADEILYQAAIDPRHSSHSLNDAQIEAIRNRLQFIVHTALQANADDKLYPKDWLFHHRWGKRPNAKTTVGQTIEFIQIGGRTTAWVPSAQS